MGNSILTDLFSELKKNNIFIGRKQMLTFENKIERNLTDAKSIKKYPRFF